jgi:hypothetical protein
VTTILTIVTILVVVGIVGMYVVAMLDAWINRDTDRHYRND